VKSAQDYRKQCLSQQSELRQLFSKPENHAQAMQLFFHQHALLHAAGMAQTEPWSFEDQIFTGLTDRQFRRIPPNREHSIAWNIWHIARIEDVALNLLVAGTPQIFNQGDWQAQMKIPFLHTGNAMSEQETLDLSAVIDLQALRAYRLAVGRQTRRIVQGLQAQDLDLKVAPDRLQRVSDEGAVIPAAQEVIDYWGRRTIAGLLLMPASRHILIHLNEAMEIKSTKSQQA
jgi:hypothetical protein